MRDGYAPAIVAVQRPRPFPERADVELFIPGVAVPKGDLEGVVVGRGPRAFCKLRTKNAAEQKQWAGQIMAALDLSQQLPFQPWAGPVALELLFVQQRIEALPRTFEIEHVRKPDSDKLTRCVLDALTAKPQASPPWPGVYTDDALVVGLTVEKRNALVGEPPGAHLRVAFLSKRVEM